MVMVSQTEQGASVTKLCSPPKQAVIHNTTVWSGSTTTIDGQAPSAAAQDPAIGDPWMMNFLLGSQRRRGRAQGNEYSPLPCALNNTAAATRRSDASTSTSHTEQQLPQPFSLPLSAARPSSSTAQVFFLSGENGGSCRRQNTDGAAHGSRDSASSQRPNPRLLPLSTPQVSSRSCRSCSSLDDDHHQLQPMSTTITTKRHSAMPNTRPTFPVLGGCGSSGLLGDGTAPAGPQQQNDGSHSAPCSPSASRPHRLDTYLYLYSRLPKVTCDVDLDRLSRSMYALQEGCFYFKGLDSLGARDMLQNAPEGTFLVRDSMDPKFLYSITVKTSKGATSVRIRYHQGFFQLDCEDEMRRKLPRFETMLDLLDFHVAVCRENKGSQYRWLESSRCKDMVVRLTAPLRHSPPSLGHQARVTINRCLKDLHLPSRSTDRLPLAPALKTYLRLYAHKI